uniref:Uncharacterized protein n=1 Tax=Oryza glumipatula TaxID=40148 RepID=A0A0E0BS55_9ORYZ
MLEVEEEDPERLTMTSADDEGVDVQIAMKTTKAAKLRTERTTQPQLYVDAAARSPRAAALQPEGGDAAATQSLMA